MSSVFKNLVYFSNESFTKNLTEILDTNWTLNNPTFEIMSRKKLRHVELKRSGFDLFSDKELILYIVIAWSSILTLIVIVLIYCIHIQSIKIKLMLPKRDYNVNK